MAYFVVKMTDVFNCSFFQKCFWFRAKSMPCGLRGKITSLFFVFVRKVPSFSGLTMPVKRTRPNQDNILLKRILWKTLKENWGDWKHQISNISPSSKLPQNTDQTLLKTNKNVFKIWLWTSRSNFMVKFDEMVTGYVRVQINESTINREILELKSGHWLFSSLHIHTYQLLTANDGH